jgi:hypothetical protein
MKSKRKKLKNAHWYEILPDGTIWGCGLGKAGKISIQIKDENLIRSIRSQCP